MAYPTLEQYNEVFQSPQLALTDPDLKKGTVATNGLGLPLALCGGFALTYTVVTSNQKYAVRCFHKQSNLLEKRYSAISNRLKGIGSPYFLPFEFQPQGVRVAGSAYPVVKMSWATGETLGEFLDKNYKNKVSLAALISSVRSLAAFLENQSISHGDIQPGNVMVSGDGQRLQLIDYDGMYVEELNGLGSNELGHRNFQHPKRSTTSWDNKLDRFSFISLLFALRVLETHPELWNKTQSDGDSILFKANDFAEPALSDIFKELFKNQPFAEDAKNFAAICKAPFQQIPSLDDFVLRRNIPQVSIAITSTDTDKPQQYISAFAVIEAANFALCLAHVGDRIELIGKVFEVKRDRTKYGKPYVFINFGHWQGNIVKIAIWSEGLSVISPQPNQDWVGKWISVTGLMDPPYTNRRYKYTHLSVTVTQNNQMRQLTEHEAKFRLGATAVSGKVGSNKELLSSIKGTSRLSTRGSTQGASSAPQQPPRTKNEEILRQMRSTAPPSSTPPTQQRPCRPTYARPSGASGTSGRPQPSPSSSNCFIATAVYGPEAEETYTLRKWRDNVLLPNTSGRILVKIYYSLSPVIAEIIERSSLLKRHTKVVLDKFIKIVKK